MTASEVFYEGRNGMAQSTSFAITRSATETILNQISLPDNWQIRATSKSSQARYHK